jgi:LDH2 family malate/lactate/ureidoglycolate dehydrogenase
MNQQFYVVPEARHNAVVGEAFLRRGYSPEEVADTVRACADAARHGIRTHHALKALHLDELFGSTKGGCVPNARVENVPTRFKASKIWNANRKSGPTVSYAAIEECIRLADEFGVGLVNVDNTFHYFWGGAYVLEAARRGYIAYTQCTALLAEVVPYGGKSASLGTNPHTWAFPTTGIVGFPILVDFATSSVAMGRVQQLLREGKRLPQGCAVDAMGEVTEDPAKVAALLPFGAHKGYGLGLVNEIVAAYIGGAIPSIRGRFPTRGKNSTCFQFMVIHPESMESGDYANGQDRDANVKAVIENILCKGNESCLLPGQLEARIKALCEHAGGLLFTEAEMRAFEGIARRLGMEWSIDGFKSVEV